MFDRFFLLKSIKKPCLFISTFICCLSLKDSKGFHIVIPSDIWLHDTSANISVFFTHGNIVQRYEPFCRWQSDVESSQAQPSASVAHILLLQILVRQSVCPSLEDFNLITQILILGTFWLGFSRSKWSPIWVSKYIFYRMFPYYLFLKVNNNSTKYL